MHSRLWAVDREKSMVPWAIKNTPEEAVPRYLSAASHGVRRRQARSPLWEFDGSNRAINDHRCVLCAKHDRFHTLIVHDERQYIQSTRYIQYVVRTPELPNRKACPKNVSSRSTGNIQHPLFRPCFDTVLLKYLGVYRMWSVLVCMPCSLMSWDRSWSAAGYSGRI